MMSHISEFLSVWITSRALGLTAYLLFFLSMATGMMQNMKGMPPSYRMSLGVIHQTASWLGWLVALTHAIILVFDDYVGFSLEEIFIPFTNEYETLAMAAGIFGLYIMIVLIASSDLMKYSGRKWWRIIHFLSFVGFGLSLYHGVAFSGLVSSSITTYLYVITLSILLFLGLFRYFHAKGPVKSDKPTKV